MVQITIQEKQYYRDRSGAGRLLAGKLAEYAGKCEVFGVPNGGMPVAAEVSARLRSGLNAIVVRKLNVPFNADSGYGAVANDGSPVYNRALMKRLGLSDRDVQKDAERTRKDIERRTAFFQNGRPFPRLVGKTVVIVDDGLSSGYSMAAAIRSIRNHRAGKVIAVAPVASEAAWHIVKSMADEIVCPVVSRSSWFAPANFYETWTELSDDDALGVLEQANHPAPREPAIARH